MAKNTLPSTTPFIFSSFHLDKNTLLPVGAPTFEEWLSCGKFLRDAEQSVQFWIGEWLLYGENHFGKTDYEAALQATGLDYQTLRDYKWVAGRVPPPQRQETLSFHHHKEVASLPEKKQFELLTQAVKGAWSLLKLKQVKFQLAKLRPSISSSSVPGFLFGDCTKLLSQLPDASIDLLLTDPPYGINYECEHREVNPFAKMENDLLEETLAVLDAALALCLQKLKANSHIYLFTSWKTYPAIVQIVETYFTVSDLLVWEKNNWTSGDLDANFGQKHEFILFAQKGQKPLNGSPASNLLSFSRVAENGRMHPTEKPLPLLEFFIEKSSLPGQVVCDPFAGVASTLVAAKKKGRTFVGMEIAKQWYDLGVNRLTATL